MNLFAIKMASAPNKRWFHPNIDGMQAKKLLIEKGLHGSFLVRFSSGERGKTNPNLTLSVRRRNEVTNIKIRRHQNGFYDLFGGEPFASLSDMIQFYMKNEELLKEKSGDIIELRFPLNCEDPTTERWFHGKISSQISSQKLMPSKHGAYLVRESQQNPGTYCLSVKIEDNVTHVKIGKTSRGFDLGGGNSFATLTELLEYYTANPIIDSTQKVVNLKHPVLITTFHVEQIFQRIVDLQKMNKEEGTNQFQNGFWEEFNSIQQQEFTNSISREEGMKPENKDKNCFRNIIPFDYTRVRLQTLPNTPCTGYINANWVRSENDRSLMKKDSSEEKEGPVLGSVGSDSANEEYKRLYKLYSSNKQYIAAQGCLKSTVPDFWQMIWQENVQVIALMHQNLTYSTKMTCIKFAKYWPELKTSVTHGKFVVTTKVEEENTDYTFREIQITCNNGNDDIEEKIVYHYHFNGWPEHGVPNRADRLLNYLYDVDKRYRLLSQVPLALLPSLTDNTVSLTDNQSTDGESSEQEKPNAISANDRFPPIVVQCHSGIGRTGSLIVIDMIIDQIKRKGFDCEIDIHRTVQSVRQQRSGMIQTEAQYTFIYAAVAHHINTIRVRLDAEMKCPREYSNLILGGEYVRAYAFQPTKAGLSPINHSNSIISKSESEWPSGLRRQAQGILTPRVRFPSVVSTTIEDAPREQRNRHVSEMTSPESQKTRELPSKTNERQRRATEKLNGLSSSFDETTIPSKIALHPTPPNSVIPPRPPKQHSGDTLNFGSDFVFK